MAKLGPGGKKESGWERWRRMHPEKANASRGGGQKTTAAPKTQPRPQKTWWQRHGDKVKAAAVVTGVVAARVGAQALLEHYARKAAETRRETHDWHNSHKASRDWQARQQANNQRYAHEAHARAEAFREHLKQQAAARGERLRQEARNVSREQKLHNMANSNSPHEREAAMRELRRMGKI